MPETITETAPPKPADPSSSPAPAKAASPASLSPYDELDQMMSAAEKPAPTQSTVKPAADKKTDATTPPDRREGVQPDDSAKAKESDDPNAPPKSDEPPKPSRAAELRTAYEKSKTRIKELEGQLEQHKKSTPIEEHPQVKALSTRIEELEKTLQEKETALKVSAYTASKDYQKNHVEPIQRAFEEIYVEICGRQQGDKMIGGLTVTDSLGNERPAHPSDFNALIQMELPDAIKYAHAVFGEAANEVLGHRRRIIQMRNDRDRAIADAHARHENLVKEQGALMTQQRQWWSEENKEAETKYTQWSKPDETDPKESEILTKSTQVADLAFSDLSHLSPKDRVKLHAAIRNKARWFDLQVYRNRKLTEQIAALEAKLDEYEASTPTTETPRRGTAPKAPATWEEELDALEQTGPR